MISVNSVISRMRSYSTRCHGLWQASRRPYTRLTSVSCSYQKKIDFTKLETKRTVNFIKTWFLDPTTKMNPNLNYAQMHRGPKGQIGTHTGILYVNVIFVLSSFIDDGFSNPVIPNASLRLSLVF